METLDSRIREKLWQHNLFKVQLGRNFSNHQMPHLMSQCLCSLISVASHGLISAPLSKSKWAANQKWVLWSRDQMPCSHWSSPGQHDPSHPRPRLGQRGVVVLVVHHVAVTEHWSFTFVYLQSVQCLYILQSSVTWNVDCSTALANVLPIRKLGVPGNRLQK